MAYLKDHVASTPNQILTVRVIDIGPTEINKNNKALKKVKFLLPSTGVTLTEGVFGFNFDKDLNGLKVNDTVEVTLKEGWPKFRIVSSTSETTDQVQSNYDQVKSERVVTENIQKENEKSIAICLQGFMQAFIIQGKHTDDALLLAVGARKKLIEKARELYTLSSFGDDTQPSL